MFVYICSSITSQTPNFQHTFLTSEKIIYSLLKMLPRTVNSLHSQPRVPLRSTQGYSHLTPAG